ncbi:unnamed protein product [Nippostrongylus brasiliensis]|uniref:40S ribosomal protein S5 (inferred by orthology to a human protein) n=1 Tax=Nippostrongylus brasiliensis TaxID=27835 RepID=A0A0N4YYI9_NIPBR|nr:unnamed protein product [Nippostrongylus brasiliensis]
MIDDWTVVVEQQIAAQPPPLDLPEPKLFNKWTLQDVDVSDISLVDYIGVKEKHSKYLPHTAGRYQTVRFRKASCPIVERLCNSMMMHGRNNGKKMMTVRIVKHAFEIIHLLSGEALWLICTGAREAAFRNIKTIAECLADEIMNAAKGSSNSYAIKKKDELERVAKSNR